MKTRRAHVHTGHLTAEELALARRLRLGLERILESPTPAAVSLPDGRILMAGGAFLRLLGHDRDSVIGMPATTLLHPRVHAEVDARRDEILAQAGSAASLVAEPYHHTLALVRRDGTEVAVRTSSVLLRTREGRPVAFITRLVPVEPADEPSPAWASGLEVADAKLLAEALEENPSFEALTEPTTLTSPNGVLLRVNRAFTLAFGWKNREVSGLPAAELLVPELRGWAEQRLVEITGAPLLPRTSTPRIRHRDGGAVAVDASSVPVRDDHGDTRYIVATVLPRTAATSRTEAKVSRSR